MRRRLATALVATLLVLSYVVGPLSGSGVLPGAGALAAFAAAAVAAPGSPQVVNDDHVARIRWSAPADPSVVGYKVSWSGGGSFFTPYLDGNLQPLLDGQSYTASVQAVNQMGDLSAPLAFSGIQTDSARVSGLRSSMTAQFDSFDWGGPINPLHWYTTGEGQIAGVTMPDGVSMNAFPMASQDHMHMETIGDGQPQVVTMRALAPFDFTNRTGTIAFDFDWGDTRSFQGGDSFSSRWFLVLSPTLVDAPLTDGNTSGMYPGDALRLMLQGTHVELDVFHNGSQIASFPAADFNKDINVRKASLFKVSQSTADLFIDGKNVLHATGLNLPWSVANVYNQQWDYDLAQFGLPARITHWDNIGFDGPAPAELPHIYTTGSGMAGDEGASSWTINVPDSLSGATGVRAFFDLKSDGNPSGTATLNGVSAPMSALPASGLPGLQSASRVIDFPLTALKQGANSLGLHLNSSGDVIKVHLEVLYPRTLNAPYTPPSDLAQGEVVPDKSAGPETHFGAHAPSSGATLSGSVPVQIESDAGTTLLPLGKVDPVVELRVLIDGTTAASLALDGPTVSTTQTLQLDTTKLTNGKHTLVVAGVSQSGAVYRSDNPDLLNNPAARSITVSNTSSTPTPTPSPSPTPSPISISGVPCVVTLNGVQQSGTCSGTFTPGP